MEQSYTSLPYWVRLNIRAEFVEKQDGTYLYASFLYNSIHPDVNIQRSTRLRPAVQAVHDALCSRSNVSSRVVGRGCLTVLGYKYRLRPAVLDGAVLPPFLLFALASQRFAYP